MTIDEINSLNDYLNIIYFNEANLKKFVDKLIRIPFGYYYMMKVSDTSLISINEHKFMQFYYWNKFHTNKNTSHLKIYKKLSSNIKFNKKTFYYIY